MKSILILEDDNNLNRGVSLLLKREGYHVCSAYTVEEATNYFEKEIFQLVICDITLPDGSGLDFGKLVRSRSGAYIIYLTALDQEIDFINGYASGADDYITKPFSLMVLASKINALMRRLEEKEEVAYISEDIEVKLKEMQVYKQGKMICLSKTELQLLIYFLENAGIVLSKENILENVWGVEGQFVDDNTVTVNISRLKTKLGTDSIANVRGLGYIWNGQVVRK